MTTAQRHLRVLIVEDQFVVALATEEVLVAAGYQVCGKAPSAEAAVSLALETQPDVIIMDVNLGRGADGIQAAVELRNAGVEAPVVFVTGEHMNARLQERIERVTDASLLPKPAFADDLRAAIDRALAIRATSGDGE